MAGELPKNPFAKQADAAAAPTEDVACPICLMKPVHPIKLPCNHVFCFLCIKGASLQGPNSRCAICRAAIPASVIVNPQLIDAKELQKEPPKAASGYRWFYESRASGWWQYDERAMDVLETAFTANQPNAQLLLAGKMYQVDLQQMIQYPQNEPRAFRKIRRDLDVAGNERKGVAGIPVAGSGDAGSSAVEAPAPNNNDSGTSPPPPQN